MRLGTTLTRKTLEDRGLKNNKKRFVVIINLKFVVVDELAPSCFSSVVIAGILINHIYSKLFVCCLFLWFYRWPFALCYNSSCTFRIKVILD